MLEQIKASAGSGKTYTLTRRFLEELCRLGEDQTPLPCRRDRQRAPGAFSEILAMTFTNKAAAEMKERVLSTLKDIALRRNDTPDPATGVTPDKARRWIDLILRRYDSLNIRTIDSFLHLLLQISSINLGIPPDFKLAFDEGEFLDPLYDELLDKAAHGDKEINALLRECAAYLLNNTTSAGLLSQGKIRIMLLDVLKKLQSLAPGELPCADKRRLEAERDASLEKIRAALRRLEDELDRLALEPKKNFSKFTEKIYAVEAGDLLPESTYAYKDSFQDCCNAKDKPLVDDALEDAYAHFRAVYSLERPHLALYESALRLLPFTKLALLLLPEITRLQNESGQIAASLKERLAGQVLNAGNGVSESFCRLGSRLNHILIDEFQDTSREQWQAILPLAEECLSRGGSLRYVGDVKQAIYNWRGGDSGLFDEIAAPQGDLAAIEPEPERTPLEYNWRSAPEVVRHNNEFFARLAEPELAVQVMKALLPKNYPDACALEAARTLAGAFTDAEQKIPAKKRGATRGYVRMQTVQGAGQDELREYTREKFGELLADLLERREPGDIAVLIRNKNEAELVAGWLADWNIGVITEHSFKLAGNPLIKRLIALLRWLDYPADDLNFLAFISGAELFARNSGLEAEDILAWELGLHKREKTDPQPLFRYFQKDFPGEWELWLEPFYRQSGLMSAYDMLSEIYNRYNLLAGAPNYAVYLRRFLELALAAEKNGFSTLSGFLEFWDGKGLEEKIPAPENPDAVRLMTIHKAKGLEFPVVVMPFHRFPGHSAAEATLCMVDGLRLLVKESEDMGADYYRGRNNTAVEVMNLLYVAWTRAGEELHVFIGGSESDHNSAGLTRAMDILLKDYNFSGDGIHCSGEAPQKQKKSDKTEQYAHMPTRVENTPSVEENWRPMSWLPKLKIFRAPVPELIYDERVRGILFHNCLENLYLPEDSQNDIEPLISRTVDFTIRGFHLPISHVRTARAELIAALAWFCSLPRARYWLAYGRPEQSIMDEKGVNYRMDMLVEEEDGSLLVLEYKSGRPRSEYSEQIGNYLRLLLKSGKRARGLLLYLDGKTLEEVAA